MKKTNVTKKSTQNLQKSFRRRKNKICEYAGNWYRKLFIENKLKEKKLYNNLSKEKKYKRDEYVHEKYRNLSQEEKYKRPEYAPKKYRNLSEDKEDKTHENASQWYRNLSKSLTFLWKYKNLFSVKKFGFSSKHGRVF